MRNILLPITIFTAVVLCGCADKTKPAGFPKLYPVSIKVIQDGQPLADAQVQLDSSDIPWMAAGTTDAAGTAVLWTYGKHEGAPAGHFTVTVTKTVNEGEEEYIAAKNRFDEAAAARAVVKSFTYVDQKFSSSETTPLTVDIDKKTKLLEVDVSPAVKIQQPHMKG